MEKIFQLKLPLKKVLPSKFSIQFNINLKIDKTKTLIVKKKLILTFSTDINISMRSIINTFRYTYVD